MKKQDAMHPNTVAYFSMEVGLSADIPTYSGGLGVLAGDIIRSAADLGVPLVAVTLLYRSGYFHQHLDPEGRQTEAPENWRIDTFLEPLPIRVRVCIERREVVVRAWRAEVSGIHGHNVPVYFLDTDLPENSECDRILTRFLYGGDAEYRLAQEIVLGIAGVRMLRALGYEQLRFHMNEGHASLLTLELLQERIRNDDRRSLTNADVEAVRDQCVFTTHTPVPAGHDRFSQELVQKVLVNYPVLFSIRDAFEDDGHLNLTQLALHLSGYVNGVAKKHREVSRSIFNHAGIDSITNGVHVATWASEPFRRLFDRYIPDWRQDSFELRHALRIPHEEIWLAHQQAKRDLLTLVNEQKGLQMNVDTFTLGFARRVTAYKRPALLFADLDRLRRIRLQTGGLQVVYAGKAHPSDAEAKDIIQYIHAAIKSLEQDIPIAYIENYDMRLGKLLTSGVDVWLNTPQPPFEASGTSGMKAAVNGVPSLSVADGWWLEGAVEGVTGWTFGGSPNGDHDACSLYEKLEKVILPLYYNDRPRFIEIMRMCIALNGSFFNTQRVLQEYVLKAYY